MSRITYWIAVLVFFSITAVSWIITQPEISTRSLRIFRTISSIPTSLPPSSSTPIPSRSSTSKPSPSSTSKLSSISNLTLSSTPTSTSSPPSSKPDSWFVNKAIGRMNAFMNSPPNENKKSSVSHNMTSQNAFHDEIIFNPKTCLVVEMRLFGRTGNNIMQIANLLRLLDICTGVAYLEERTRITGVRFPSLITHAGMYLSAESRTQVAKTCYNVTLSGELYKIEQLFNALKRSSCPITREQFITHKYSKRTETMIQSLIGFDRSAHMLDLTNTVVAHVRGGDVFISNPHKRYQQPPCSFYINSIRHANASRAIVITQDLRNPCVVEILRNVPDTGLLLGGSVTGALTILLRAPILVQAYSTFNRVAVGVSYVPKTVYREYGGETWYTNHVIRDCQVSYDNSTLLPWKASPKQLHLLRVSPSKVERCVEQ